MRRIILQLHLIVALAGSAFIVMLGLTGSIMAFEPELGRLQHWKIAHVRSHGIPLSLEKIGMAMRNASPDRDISGYVLSDRPDLSYQVMTERQLVYVDQLPWAGAGYDPWGYGLPWLCAPAPSSLGPVG